MTAWGSDSQRSETNRLRVPQGCRKASTSLLVLLPFSHQRRFRINIPQKIKMEDVMLIHLSTVSKARHLVILTAIRVISNSTIMLFHQQAFFQMEMCFPLLQLSWYCRGIIGHYSLLQPAFDCHLFPFPHSCVNNSVQSIRITFQS